MEPLWVVFLKALVLSVLLLGGFAYLTLVQRSASEGQSSAVLGSVVELAARTGALVIAEGIEHEAQLDPLRALGITVGQGYYLGRPGPLVPTGAAPQAPEVPLVGVSAWRQSMGLPAVR